MNKKDIILIISSVLIIVMAIIFLSFKEEGSYATVYHGKDIILNIDLNIDKTYEVNGDNGLVVIEVKDKKIRVNEENSPLKLCSKQGFISNKSESIICLPNKIIIEIVDEEIDTQVR